MEKRLYLYAVALQNSKLSVNIKGVKTGHIFPDEMLIF